MFNCSINLIKIIIITEPRLLIMLQRILLKYVVVVNRSCDVYVVNFYFYFIYLLIFVFGLIDIGDALFPRQLVGMSPYHYIIVLFLRLLVLMVQFFFKDLQQLMS